MVISLIFWALALVACIYAALYGNGAGKWGAGLVVAVTAGTTAATWSPGGWIRTNDWLLLVDGLYFLSLYVLAVRSHRYWPIWSAGFQLLSTLTHVAKFVDRGVLPSLYEGLEQFWAIPIMIAMVVGIHLDCRAKLLKESVDYHGRSGSL